MPSSSKVTRQVTVTTGTAKCGCPSVRDSMSRSLISHTAACLRAQRTDPVTGKLRTLDQVYGSRRRVSA